MEPYIFYQDNMSAILLETNGKVSSSKCIKHIKVKYFYVKDKTDHINTKPKQGVAFREFRCQIMGIPMTYNDNDFNSLSAMDGHDHPLKN
jgi:hypothetical protein